MFLIIKWTDMVTNEEILEIISERRTPWSNIKKRRNQWIRNVLKQTAQKVKTIRKGK